MLRNPMGTVLLAGLLLLGGGPSSIVGATPIASVSLIETAVGGGYRYDLTLFNQGDMVTDVGFDLYDVTLFTPTGVSLVDAVTPYDWQVISASGFLNTFSIQPGAFPVGTDVGPGQSLSGFSFTFDGQLRLTTFQALLTNPEDISAPIVVDGVAEPLSVTAVPEPASIGLLSLGLSAWVIRRYRIKAGVLSVVRFGGHIPCGGDDAQTDGRHTDATAPSLIH